MWGVELKVKMNKTDSKTTYAYLQMEKQITCDARCIYSEFTLNLGCANRLKDQNKNSIDSSGGCPRAREHPSLRAAEAGDEQAGGHGGRDAWGEC